MALQVRRSPSIKVRIVATLMMVFALVAQPLYGFISTQVVNAVSGVDYTSTGFGGLSWGVDRTLPSGSWSQSGDALTMTVDGTKQGSDVFEGVKATLPVNTTDVSAKLFIDPAWSTQSVIAGMWGVAHYGSDVTDTAWPTLEFNNVDHATASVDVWDTFDGLTKGVTTVAYGDTVELEIQANTITNKFTYYLNNTPIYTSPAQGYGPITTVIFNNYNDGATERAYSTRWTDLRTGTLARPDVPKNLTSSSQANDDITNGATSINFVRNSWTGVNDAVSYNYEFSKPGGLVTYATNTTNTFMQGEFHNANSPEGQYGFRVQSVGANGLIGDWSDWSNVSYDKTAPVISNVRVANPVAGIAEIRVDIDDVSDLDLRNGKTHVRFFQGSQMTNGAAASSANVVFAHDAANDDYVATIDTTDFADNGSGSYWVYVRAEDKFGHASSNNKTRGVIVENISPRIDVKPESAGSVSNKVFRNVSFKLFDGFKIDKITLNDVTKELSNSNYSDLNNVKPGMFGAVEGTNTLVAYDVAGNTKAYVFTLDTNAATGTFTYSNNNGDAVTADDVIVTLKTNENVKVPNGWTQKENAMTFEKTHQSNGKFTVAVEDIAGNVSTLKYEVKRIDRTAPVINGIAEGVLYGRDVTYTVIETSIDKVFVDGVSYSQKDAPYTITDDGVHTVRVLDKAGNQIQVSFEIDQTAPVVTPNIAANAVLSGVATIKQDVTERNPKSFNIRILNLDGSPVAHDGVNQGAYDASLVSGDSLSFDWNTHTVANGQYKIQFSAADFTNTTTTLFRTVTVNNPQPTVLGENFNTHSSTDYKGVNVGFNIANFKTVTGVSVALYDAEDNLLATNTHNQKLLDLVEGGATQLSTPFIGTAGTYIEEFWNPGVPSWTRTNKPAKAIVTVSGTNNNDVNVVAPVTLTQLSEANDVTFESTLPLIGIVPVGPPVEDAEEDPAPGADDGTLPLIINQLATASPLPGSNGVIFGTSLANGFTSSDAQQATSDETSAVLGTQTSNEKGDVSDIAKNVAVIEPSAEGWKFFGFAWYWLALLTAAIATIWYIVARRRNQDA